MARTSDDLDDVDNDVNRGCDTHREGQGEEA
jgi:hypothetical protein